MTVTMHLPSLRGLAIGIALVFVGAVLGSTLVGSVSAATQTRVVSCAGLNFYPTDYLTTYDNSGPLRTRLDSNGSGVFRCDPGLPNKAVVTKVRFTLLDQAGTPYLVDSCALNRSGLTTTTATSFQALASVPGTSSVGIERLTDSTIDFNTINNALFGYWIECRINGAAPYVGIYGADVTYTISSANG